MTDDEAFVRAIVDSPGDDTPRLVYADWLDDRDDPRGPYLRAERELARNDAGGLTALRRSLVTTNLDSLWAARVSRPPAGVCSDHLRFTDCGPCTADQLAAVESEIGVRLSRDLTAFFLNYNGGSHWLRVILPNGGGRFDYTLDELTRGVQTPDDPGSGGLTLTEQAQAFWDDFTGSEDDALARSVLPFGTMNGLLLFERLTTDDAGAIGICDTGDGDLWEMRRLAPNLAAFLGMLTLRSS